jgi:hypothetical protein
MILAFEATGLYKLCSIAFQTMMFIKSTCEGFREQPDYKPEDGFSYQYCICQDQPKVICETHPS